MQICQNKKSWSFNIKDFCMMVISVWIPIITSSYSKFSVTLLEQVATTQHVVRFIVRCSVWGTWNIV